MSDFLSAFAVGINEVLIGHPLNTAKVLIQNKQKWLGLPFKHYYRGVKYPLLSSTFFNMLTFPMNERLYKHTNNYFVSGMFCGVVASPIVFFIDTFTIKRQTNQNVSFSMFKGARGLYSTMLRESIASSLYFGTYYFMHDDLKINSLVSGGAAGLCNWTFSYPIDVVRSRQIAQRITINEAIKMGNIWSGFSIVAFRAILVNSIGFTVFKYCNLYLREV